MRASRVGQGSPPGPFGISYPAATEYGAGLFLDPAAGDRAGLVLGHPAGPGDRAGVVLADPAAAEHRAPRPGG